MADDPDVPDDERAMELTAIEAIFPELQHDPKDPFTASIELPINPIESFSVLFPQLADGAPPTAIPTPPNSDGEGNSEGNAEDAPFTQEIALDVHQLSHLPPLKLDIVLPSGYPASNPPRFALSTSPSWLPAHTIRELEEYGEQIWEDFGRDQVVYSYIDHLQQAAERGFDLVKSRNAPFEIPQDLKIALLDFDIKAKKETFHKGTFDCGVCLGKIFPFFSLTLLTSAYRAKERICLPSTSPLWPCLLCRMSSRFLQ
jgi:E3 ubiquitin-protein ligase RNF14